MSTQPTSQWQEESIKDISPYNPFPLPRKVFDTQQDMGVNYHEAYPKVGFKLAVDAPDNPNVMVSCPKIVTVKDMHVPGTNWKMQDVYIGDQLILVINQGVAYLY